MERFSTRASVQIRVEVIDTWVFDDILEYGFFIHLVPSVPSFNKLSSIDLKSVLLSDVDRYHSGITCYYIWNYDLIK